MAGERARRISGRSFISQTSAGILRVTLLFGSAAIALTLILVPIADKHARDRMFASRAVAGHRPDVDGQHRAAQSAAKTYTIRRSVLQPSPNSVCIIRESGARSGSC